MELKPCPFCGGKASLYKENGEVWIECENCHCGTAFVNGASSIEVKMSAVIKDWNRRVGEGGE